MFERKILLFIVVTHQKLKIKIIENDGRGICKRRWKRSHNNDHQFNRTKLEHPNRSQLSWQASTRRGQVFPTEEGQLSLTPEVHGDEVVKYEIHIIFIALCFLGKLQHDLDGTENRYAGEIWKQ